LQEVGIERSVSPEWILTYFVFDIEVLVYVHGLGHEGAFVIWCSFDVRYSDDSRVAGQVVGLGSEVWSFGLG
jgi:hypothetical protein